MKVHLGKIKGVGGQEQVHQSSQSSHTNTANSPSSSRLLGYQNFYSGLLLRLPPSGDASCSQMLQATARAMQSGDGEQDGVGSTARGQTLGTVGEGAPPKVMLPQGSSGIVLKTVGFPGKCSISLLLCFISCCSVSLESVNSNLNCLAHGTYLQHYHVQMSIKIFNFQLSVYTNPLCTLTLNLK